MKMLMFDLNQRLKTTDGKPDIKKQGIGQVDVEVKNKRHDTQQFRGRPREQRVVTANDRHRRAGVKQHSEYSAGNVYQNDPDMPMMISKVSLFSNREQQLSIKNKKHHSLEKRQVFQPNYNLNGLMTMRMDEGKRQNSSLYGIEQGRDDISDNYAFDN